MYCSKPTKSKNLAVVKTCTANSAGNSSIEAGLDGDLVPLCGRRLCMYQGGCLCVKDTLTQ